MKNKGFTVIEVLAVVVILGILTSIAMINYTKYREDVKKKELVNLHSSVEVAYDKYRADVLVKGESPNNDLENIQGDDSIYKYFSDLSFDGDKLSNISGVELSVYMKKKGELLKNDKYPKDERDLVQDGTCLTTSVVDDSSGENKLVSECVKDDEGKVIPSQEELLCVVFKANGQTLIDDYEEKVSQRELCTFFE